MATLNTVISKYLAISPFCISMMGINVYKMTSAKKCANMALSRPNVQNNQPNTNPPIPFKTNV